MWQIVVFCRIHDTEGQNQVKVWCCDVIVLIVPNLCQNCTLLLSFQNKAALQKIFYHLSEQISRKTFCSSTKIL